MQVKGAQHQIDHKRTQTELMIHQKHILKNL